MDPFIILFLEMTVQKLAICPSMSSRHAVFYVAVSPPLPSSFVNPLLGLAAVFFSHVVPSVRYGVNLSSSESVNIKFCFQLWNDVTVSIFVSCHCLGAQTVV